MEYRIEIDMLNFLNEEEKKNFLELAYNVATCDNDYDPHEKHWIDDYRSKLDLTDYEIQEKPLDEILDSFDDKSFIAKTSILLEIMSLALANYNYDGSQQKILQKLRDKWDVDDEQFKEIAYWLKDKELILKKENLD